MGIHKALNDSADFTKLSSKRGLNIDTVIQNVVLDITEGGAHTSTSNFGMNRMSNFHRCGSFNENY